MGLRQTIASTLYACMPRLDRKIGTKYANQVPQDSSPRGAMFSLAYVACELAKARPVSVLPVHVYERTDKGRVEATDDASFYLGNLLTTRWNPTLKSADGLRWVMLAKDTMGQCAVRIQWGKSLAGNRVPTALYPIYGNVTMLYDADTGGVSYQVPGDDFTPSGEYGDDEILIFRSPLPCMDANQGRSLAEAAANTVGLSIDLEDFYHRLLLNGSHFPGWLETDQRLTPDMQRELVAQLQGSGGLVNAGQIRVFDNGLKYRTNDMNMADINLIEQQTWVLEQMCRITGVPPQEVYDLSHSTYSNTEQGSIQFAQKTLMPECRESEMVFDQVLRICGYFKNHVKFDLNGMLRGEYEARMEGYRTGIYAGFFTRNEVRSWEELPALEGLDRALLPVNYYEVDEDGNLLVPEGERETRGSQYSDPNESPIYQDMARRVKDRVADKGDGAVTRTFARKVLTPWANACLLEGVSYDLEADIERLCHE